MSHVIVIIRQLPKLPLRSGGTSGFIVMEQNEREQKPSLHEGHTDRAI